MTARRTKPQMGKTQSAEPMSKSENSEMGCVAISLGIVIAYFVASAIVGVLFNSASKLDQVICFGLLILLAIGCAQAVRDMYRDKKAREAETKKWLEGCTVAQANIVDRHEGGTYEDDWGRFRSFPCRLELEMNADQRAVFPNVTTVSVDVSQHIYRKLAERGTVRVYYLPKAPLTFLLEDET